MKFEDLVGKTVVEVHRPLGDQPKDEEDSFVIVFDDGTRVGFEPDAYSPHYTTHWVISGDPPVICSVCNGSGQVAAVKKVSCPQCRGSGRIET